MAIKIFCCYAHDDEPFLKKLKKHLRVLQQQELIDVRDDYDISPGTEWERDISEQLDVAEIILLLVSADFMVSDYCYSIEMKRAIERYEHGEAQVIPIILRHVYWKETPFGKFKALPTEGKPVTSWQDEDEAFLNIAEGIRKIARELQSNSSLHQTPTSDKAAAGKSPNIATIEATSIEDLGDEGEIINIDDVSNPQASSASSAVFLPPLKPIHPLGTLYRTFNHDGIVTGIAWSPNGAYFASTGRDGTMRIWDATTAFGDPGLGFRYPNQRITGLAWSPDGTFIATATSTGVLDICAIVNSRLVAYDRYAKQIDGYSQQLDLLCWSHDGKAIAFRIATYSIAFGTLIPIHREIQVRHMDTKIVLTYDNHSSDDGYTPQITSLAWSPNSRRIASANRNVHIWNATNGVRECTFHDSTSHSLASVTWSPDGRYTASGGFDKTVQIWDTYTGNHIFTYEGHRHLRNGKVQLVAWSPNGAYIASVSDKIIQVWSVLTGKLIYIYQGHSSKVTAIAWSPDGQRIASIGDSDNKVHIWHATQSYNPFLYTRHVDKVLGLAWSLDGAKIASYASNTVQVWQAM